MADLYIQTPYDQTTFPNPYFVSLLSIALGQSEYFRDTGMNEYVHTPTWSSFLDFIKTNTSSSQFEEKDRHQLLYIYNAAFGNGTSAEEAAKMVDGLPHRNVLGTILGVHLSVILVAVVFVAMRFYSRLRVLTGPKREDWLILAGLICFVSSSVISFIGVGKAYGHIYDVPGSVLNAWFRMGVIVFYPLIIGMCLVKISFLDIYRSLVPSSERFTRICYAVAVFIIIGSIAYLVALSLICYPTAVQWKEPLNRRCSEKRLHLNLALSVFYVATDLMILALPTTIVWNMKLPTKTKVGVIFMFMLGTSACIFSILRTVSSSIKNVDFTWHALPTLIYTMLEMYIGVICACLPALRNLCATNTKKRMSNQPYRSRQRSRSRSRNNIFRSFGSRRGIAAPKRAYPGISNARDPLEEDKARGMSYGGEQNLILSGILKRSGNNPGNYSSELEELKEEENKAAEKSVFTSVQKEKPEWKPKATTYDDYEADDLVIGEDLGDSYRRIHRAIDAGYTFGGSSMMDLEKGRR